MPSEKQFQSNARKLRNEMTKQERHLWYDFLRNFEIQFYRQKVIENYIVDFYCARAKVVVELDGG
jgi:very-short-patch-repair endonuclease